MSGNAGVAHPTALVDSPPPGDLCGARESRVRPRPAEIGEGWRDVGNLEIAPGGSGRTREGQWLPPVVPNSIATLQ